MCNTKPIQSIQNGAKNTSVESGLSIGGLTQPLKHLNPSRFRIKA